MRRNLIAGRIVLLVCVIAHMGAIRRQESPVQRTQTDPISIEDKMEEVKDGEKGPPLPSIKFYKQSDFQVQAPVQEDQPETAVRKDQIPDAGARIPEDLSGMEKSAESFEDWWTEAWEEEGPGEAEADKKEDVWEDTWQDEWSKDSW